MPPLELAATAAKAALHDAGLQVSDIDGLMTMNLTTDALSLAMGMQDLRITNDYAAGGRWVVPALQHATQCLVAGSANAVLIVLALSRTASYADSAAPGGNAAFEAMHAMGGRRRIGARISIPGCTGIVFGSCHPPLIFLPPRRMLVMV